MNEQEAIELLPMGVKLIDRCKSWQAETHDTYRVGEAHLIVVTVMGNAGTRWVTKVQRIDGMYGPHDFQISAPTTLRRFEGRVPLKAIEWSIAAQTTGRAS